jgi:hypothetical protein
VRIGSSLCEIDLFRFVFIWCNDHVHFYLFRMYLYSFIFISV